MSQRIMASGFKAVFLGKSRVHDKVVSFRRTKHYLRRGRFQSSRNRAISKKFVGDRRVFNTPLYLFPQTLRAAVRSVTRYLTQPTDETFFREMIV